MIEDDWMRIFNCIITEDLAALASVDPRLLNDNDSNGDTPLIAAIGHGSLAVVRLLLSKGADPNFLNRTVAYSALYNAVDAKRLDIVSVLLGAGADPDLGFPGLSSARDLAEDLKLSDCLSLFDSFGTEAVRPSTVNFDCPQMNDPFYLRFLTLNIQNRPVTSGQFAANGSPWRISNAKQAQSSVHQRTS